MISEEQFIKSAKELGCSVAAIKAVAQVESAGGGFILPGVPKILFEPHIFWKELRKLGITPQVSDICYPVWKTRPYGKSSEQHGKLQRAVLINREAAFKSASWGMFQIMGFNYKTCGCFGIQEFINAMYTSEDKQLDLFDNYIKASYLDDELRNLDWAGFARGYNGASYARNNYHIKLAAAYKKFNS